MVIRSGLIPGVVDRDRQGCTPGGPTNSILGSPAGIRTRTSRPVRASVLPLDEGAVLKPIARPLFPDLNPGKAASPSSSPPLLGWRAGGSYPSGHSDLQSDMIYERLPGVRQ